MKLGIIGLGRMGNSIAKRVIDAGFEVLGHIHKSEKNLKAAIEIGVKVTRDISEIAKNTRIIWLMVPHGKIVDDTIEQLLPFLKEGDIIIDGGNSNFHDSIRRAKELEKRSIYFLDIGTSGGLKGRDIGFSLMVGGEKIAYEKIIPILKAIAFPNGYNHFGVSGTGHYIKMTHNAIEYGILQAYAEGFCLLKEGYYKNLDFKKISNVWLNGSVIRSWILELAHEVNIDNLEKISGEIEEGGTGLWAMEEASKHNLKLPLIDQALKTRQWSRESGGNFVTKFIALLRNKFGGHKVHELHGP